MDIRKTILIADDMEINRSILEDIFCEQYNILMAEDGETAIDTLIRNRKEISLVLLDLMMPKKNGFEVLQFMKEHYPGTHVPVIVITGSDDYQDELHAYNLGAADIIHKPFIPQIVMRRAENVMELFEHRKELERQLRYRTKALDNVRTYDPLTGLYNMQFFLQEANKHLREADADGSYGEYYFIYSNIRNFKFHNMNFGQEAGDRVLRALADKVREVQAEDKLHARFGNDHIVTLIKRDDVMECVRGINQFFETEFGKTGLTLKIGVYHVKKAGEPAALACDLAKIACDSIYSSNECISEYNDDISRKMNIRNYVLQHFDEALENEYIQVYYQPVIRTVSGIFCGMEALARWIDPVMGFLSPADFISVLEENNLISKLDLYMLRMICKEMKEAQEKRLDLIPVSFNLSRMDFTSGDIFEEIEKIVREYGIARDMINIEITESVVMDNPEYMRKIIEDIRNAGYQIWMDDFGSGYSSLNVLKDYQFDEIKLDMKFLSSFDDNSKKIIESVILMAKKLGIQTLAEGVETQEQLDYLRSIGCEKAQGYLFSKPLPIKVLYEKCLKEQTKVEQRGWRDYYNRIGGVNFITDRALSIVEYRKGMFEYLFINPAFQAVLQSLGVTDMKMVYENVNFPTSPLHRQFRDVQRSLHVGDGFREILYSIRGQYMRLTIVCLAEHEDRSVFDVEITNLTNKDVETKRVGMDNVFRMIYALYDSGYLLDLDSGKFEVLMKSDDSAMLESQIFHEQKKINPVLAATAFIHPSEQEEYLRFTDLDTLVDRLKQEERRYLAAYFRTKAANGAYVWKLHTLLYVAEINSIIYCSRAASFKQEGLVDRIMPEYLRSITGEIQENIYRALHRGMIESKSINLFWKDTERRFLGANEHFLETYGFQDDSAILGKTDEEMGWNIDSGQFQDDEWQVLEKGEVITNQLGKCIIRGVMHNILVSKEPLYQDGKIIGLVGTFIDMDDVSAKNETSLKFSIMDQVTGLLSANGLAGAVADYMEGWAVRRENFAVIRIVISEYARADQTYGEKTAKKMLREIGQIISETFDIRGTCARLFAGSFVVLMKAAAKEEVTAMADLITQKLSQIHILAGRSASIYPKVDVSFADETENIRFLIGMATSGTLMDITEQKHVEA